MSRLMRLLLMMAVLACWVGCGFAGTVDSAGVRNISYTPDDFERAILDAVRDSAAKSSVIISYDPRMSLAIYNTLNGRDSADSQEIGRLLQMAGPHSLLIPIDTSKGVTEYATQCQTLVSNMADKIRLGAAYVNMAGKGWLAVYATDIYIGYDRAKTFQGTGLSPFPDLPGPYEMSISGTINSDSGMYILYRGESVLAIPQDSIVMAKSFPIESNNIIVYIQGEKYGTEIMTVNLYARNSTIGVFELIGIDYAPVMLPCDHGTDSAKKVSNYLKKNLTE